MLLRSVRGKLALAVLCAHGLSASSEFERYATLPLPELKARLQSEGWPAGHVQAFLGAEIQRRVNPPDQPRPDELRVFEFWRTGPDAEPFPAEDLRRREAERFRRETQAREAFDALFPATEDEPSPALADWNLRREWGDLPPAKRNAVQARRARATQERDALMQPRAGMLTSDEWQAVHDILEGGRRDVSAILTAAEMLDLDLRTSLTANRLRRELDNFQPTREEFLTLFRILHPLELAFDHKPRGIDPEFDRRRTSAEADADRQIASALGPQRYSDYRLSLDPACQLLQFDGRFARIGAAEVRALYRSLLAAKAELASIERSGRPSSAKAAAQRVVKQREYDRFRAKLDEEATRRYLQEQGFWPISGSTDFN